MKPERPVLRWHGGKWLLAPWIISHFPAHRVYVEPFGGAWSVGFQKERAYAEIWNDLDDELWNLFQVLKDTRRAQRLVHALELTPFARTEFEQAYRPSRNSVERARRLLVRSFMGHGSDGGSGVYRTGFRAASNRSGTTPAHDWVNFTPALGAIIDRLRGVVIEHRPALQVMARHDAPDTLHYVDPPYLVSTRSRAARRPDNGGVYRHEMTEQDHVELIQALDALEGMVVLSAYPAPIYDQLLAPKWTCIERKAFADGALERIECLWLNPAACQRMAAGPLFEMVTV
ncbi:UNVERIFIED_ORG: DNA adenine methylase [Sphingomonas sp. R1F5B]